MTKNRHFSLALNQFVVGSAGNFVDDEVNHYDRYYCRGTDTVNQDVTLHSKEEEQFFEKGQSY